MGGSTADILWLPPSYVDINSRHLEKINHIAAPIKAALMKDADAANMPPPTSKKAKSTGKKRRREEKQCMVVTCVPHTHTHPSSPSHVFELMIANEKN